MLVSYKRGGLEGGALALGGSLGLVDGLTVDDVLRDGLAVGDEVGLLLIGVGCSVNNVGNGVVSILNSEKTVEVGSDVIG